MKDKLILVFYLNVDGMEDEKAKLYISEVSNNVKNDSYHAFIIPVTNQETKIDCINPKLVDSEEWNRHNKKFIEAKEALEKFVASRPVN